ncbi:deoxycytidine kinase 2-like isoform X3 [Narcine bancroftii]|uniref:deoxycytidine kinase 2-like isoform X3 n=1 Tax=Narcine bancroftii TaxID=1343680 RepID=UPI0038320058
MAAARGGWTGAARLQSRRAPGGTPGLRSLMSACQKLPAWSRRKAPSRRPADAGEMSTARARSPLGSSAVTPAVTRMSVEGNIAVGKSTFAKLLEQVNGDQWEVVPEPIAKWCNIPTSSGNKEEATQRSVGNLLQMLYQDPHRWSYTFQSFSCISRIKTHLAPLTPKLLRAEKPVQIFERSVYSDRKSFDQRGAQQLRDPCSLRATCGEGIISGCWKLAHGNQLLELEFERVLRTRRVSGVEGFLIVLEVSIWSSDRT